MADSLTSLRRRIGSAADLQSVVRAMRAQAAASVGQYARSVVSLGEYTRTVELGLGACFRQRPLVEATASVPDGSADRPIHVVVFGSDQGLVGRFNDTIVDYAREALPTGRQAPRVWAVGDRMRASLSAAGMSSLHTFAVPATVQAITRLVTDILVNVVDVPSTSALSGHAFELHLFYNHPTTGSAYVPVGQRLLPLDEAWRLELARRPWPSKLPAEVVGDSADTMRALISEYVFVSLFRAGAASLASENASRLAAMDRADRNIDTMLGALNERFHRLRQGRIDEELSDVVAGFKALHR